MTMNIFFGSYLQLATLVIWAILPVGVSLRQNIFNKLPLLQTRLGLTVC